jgi:hypothetical protein
LKNEAWIYKILAETRFPLLCKVQTSSSSPASAFYCNFPNDNSMRLPFIVSQLLSYLALTKGIPLLSDFILCDTFSRIEKHTRINSFPLTLRHAIERGTFGCLNPIVHLDCSSLGFDVGGWSLFLTEDIPAETFITEYSGLRLYKDVVDAEYEESNKIISVQRYLSCNYIVGHERPVDGDGLGSKINRPSQGKSANVILKYKCDRLWISNERGLTRGTELLLAYNVQQKRK